MSGNQKVVQFPMPPRFWDTPGDVPSYRLWTMQFDNYVFSIDSQRTPAKRMSDECKNRLPYLLLGTEGIASFACMPEGQDLTGTSFADFQKAVKRHFQPTTSPIRAFFDFQSRKQHEGESASSFCNALRTLLVDCDVLTEVECKTLLAHQLVFGCHDYPTVQKSLTLKEMNFEAIFVEMESQEKVNENVRVIHGSVSSGRMSVSVAMWNILIIQAQ